MKYHTILAIACATLFPLAGLAQNYTVSELSPAGSAEAISNGVVGGNSLGRATLWSSTGAVDVHPANYLASAILGRNGAVSVGWGRDATSNQVALAWNQFKARVLGVPFTYVFAQAVATDGTQIVGSANPSDPERGVGPAHGLVWSVSTKKVIDLGSKATLIGVGGGIQVGSFATSKGAAAAMWLGTARSRVNLHPKFADASVATGTNGVIEIGYVGVDVRVRSEARPRKIRFYSAGFWSGSEDSFTDLYSPYRHSFALGIQGDTIVGYGNTTDAIGTPIANHAMAWVGDAQTFVDLHALLPAFMVTSRATSVDEFGNIAGYGYDATGQVHGFVWLRNP